jgi:hypothetical protein
MEETMTAFFGIEEHNAQGFLEKKIVCLPRSPEDKPELHSIVSAIKSEDIVFIKRCKPQSSLHIKAIGVVLSDYPTESDLGICLPVDWVWQGEKVLENFDEVLSLCGYALYEEHNILVQREIISLLPEKYQLPQEW